MKKVLIFAILLMISFSFVLAADLNSRPQPVLYNAQGGSAYMENSEFRLDNNSSNMTVEQRRERFEEGKELRIEIMEEHREKAREIRIERIKNQMRIHAGNYSVNCSGECEFNESGNRSVIMKRLSNGRNAEIKVMPDTAAERALERLRLKVCNESNNCTIELKEVGGEKDVSFVYEINRDRKAKFLGFIKSNMAVRAQVDSETGEVVKIRKPWWAFLASEPEEIEEVLE